MESFAKIDSLPPEKRRLLAQYLGNKLARRPIKGEAFISQGQILPLNREVDSFPLSFAQQRLWFLDQFDPDNPSYNLPIAIRLIGILDTFVLERCMQEMVQRHEILRTIFTISEGKPRQVIIPALPMVLPLIDLTFLPTSEREDEMIHCSTKEMHRPFDLASGPLMRAYLLQ